MGPAKRKIVKTSYRVRRALRPDSPGRGVAVDRHDVFLASYPRSGNTWIRFILTALMKPNESLTRELVRRTIPDIYTDSPGYIAKVPRPRILKSHEYFDPRYRRVIYLVRDPRDVAASYFHFYKTTDSYRAGMTIEEFVGGMVAGSLDNFGTWREHVNSWLATRGSSDDFLLVKYEDLRADPYGQSELVVQFIGLPWTPDALRKAVEATTFQQMTRIASRDISPERRELLARRGTPGGWKDEVPTACSELIASEFADAMAPLGYL